MGIDGTRRGLIRADERVAHGGRTKISPEEQQIALASLAGEIEAISSTDGDQW